MSQVGQEVVVAVVQAAPVGFETGATLDKVRRLVREAAQGGAQLVLFPEAFWPGYPRGQGFGAVVGSRTEQGRDDFRILWEHAAPVPGEFSRALASIAKESGVYLAIGVVEREETCGRGTLYCTLLYFAPDGNLLHKHRKLKPTGSERLIWGEGDGSTLRVLDTPLGKIGGLICWENYMPAARLALYGEGIEIYLAPTADARDTWQATLRHIACEGRCFVLGCNQFVSRNMLPDEWQSAGANSPLPDVTCRGGSAIYSPLGECLAGPLYDQEGLLFARLDRNDLARSKLDFDPVGHYSRPDIFQLRVNRAPLRSVAFDEPSGEDAIDSR